MSHREAVKNLRSSGEYRLREEGVSDRQGTGRWNQQPRKRAAVILAGGRSSRFGSNKALKALAGKTLVRHIVERASGVADEVLVVAGRGEDAAQYRSVLPDFVRVVNDELEGKTPLVGIVAGLQVAKSDYAAILACDIPFVNEEVIELLFRRASNADAAIPSWNGQRIEPLEAVYRRLPTLQAARETLAPPDLSLEDMIRKLGRVVYVSVEAEIRKLDHDLSTFFNINTKEDMATAEKMLTEKTPPLERSRPQRDK